LLKNAFYYKAGCGSYREKQSPSFVELQASAGDKNYSQAPDCMNIIARHKRQDAKTLFNKNCQRDAINERYAQKHPGKKAQANQKSYTLKHLRQAGFDESAYQPMMDTLHKYKIDKQK